jgi:hypothetical protein
MQRAVQNQFYIVLFLTILSGCKGPERTLKMQKNIKTRLEMTESAYTGNLTDSFMVRLLQEYPQFFDKIVRQKDQRRLQIIYTQIDREKNGSPRFTDYAYNLNPGNYFYPASTVKLPVAILALQKLNELNIKGLDRNTTMISESSGYRQTDVFNDPSSEDGRPSIAQYIKKILLVSDNDAFNRLYEFLGQEYINETLHRMGFTRTQIIHRLEVNLTETENRATNPITFFDSTGAVIYQQPGKLSELKIEKDTVKLGKGFIRNGQMVNEPFDFTLKNRMPLPDLHEILKSILFTDALPEEQRFNLTDDDLTFLRKYMSMMPQESLYPEYDPKDYWDTYVKFLYYGSLPGTAEKNIRIFNKVGDAYGFLTDAAYIIDFSNNIEFMVSATIYVNSNEIFNDDTYDYDLVGLPFMKDLGRVLYKHEKKRNKKSIPDLSAFRYSYKK